MMSADNVSSILIDKSRHFSLFPSFRMFFNCLPFVFFSFLSKFISSFLIYFFFFYKWRGSNSSLRWTNKKQIQAHLRRSKGSNKSSDQNNTQTTTTQLTPFSNRFTRRRLFLSVSSIPLVNCDWSLHFIKAFLSSRVDPNGRIVFYCF